MAEAMPGEVCFVIINFIIIVTGFRHHHRCHVLTSQWL
jgi:hypothetical protein